MYTLLFVQLFTPCTFLKIYNLLLAQFTFNFIQFLGFRLEQLSFLFLEQLFFLRLALKPQPHSCF